MWKAKEIETYKRDVERKKKSFEMGIKTVNVGGDGGDGKELQSDSPVPREETTECKKAIGAWFTYKKVWVGLWHRGRAGCKDVFTEEGGRKREKQ